MIAPPSPANRSVLPWMLPALVAIRICLSALQSEAEELQVFAAASLTEAFTEIGTKFEVSAPGNQVVFNFSGSQTLRTQIEQGAQADLYASASQASMAALTDKGRVEAPQVFALPAEVFD